MSNASASSSTPVSNLDANDQRALCSSVNAYLDTYVDADQIAYAACLPQALVLGVDSADCERRLDQCMALSKTHVTVQVQADNSQNQTCLDNVRRCNATLADVEGCVNVNVTTIYDVLDWSCARIDNPNARSEAQDVMRKTSVCTKGNAACGEVTQAQPQLI